MKNNLNAFVVADPQKCIGCKACEVACFTVHNQDNKVCKTVGSVSLPVIPRLFVVKTPKVTMPVQCRHCEDAPCANSCSISAIRHENDSIIIDEENCIGCKSCIMACPFGAIDLLPKYQDGKEVIQLNLMEDGEKGFEETTRIVAYKCDLCKDHDKHACIAACPQDALRLVVPQEDKKSKNKNAALSLADVLKNYK